MCALDFTNRTGFNLLRTLPPCLVSIFHFSISSIQFSHSIYCSISSSPVFVRLSMQLFLSLINFSSLVHWLDTCSRFWEAFKIKLNFQTTQILCASSSWKTTTRGTVNRCSEFMLKFCFRFQFQFKMHRSVQ